MPIYSVDVFVMIDISGFHFLCNYQDYHMIGSFLVYIALLS